VCQRVTRERGDRRLSVMGAALKTTSAASTTLAKTRVGGFDREDPHRIGVRRDVVPGSHWGKRLCRCGAASGSRKYLQPDPLLTSSTLSGGALMSLARQPARLEVFSYASNNPILLSDPSGLYWICVNLSAPIPGPFAFCCHKKDGSRDVCDRIQDFVSCGVFQTSDNGPWPSAGMDFFSDQEFGGGLQGGSGGI
jgi:hypothetical protein